ncbi:TPA: hypothetical protein ACGJ09_004129 [Pseudomonas aeruginosa]|uniref:hypothetical protein n=1 Tax=Pseudomonas aeruginosa TaxID=287 RepID=UPI000AD769B1|nr:hypothetical protein [Pseudomonas aeruginosa]
MTKANECTCPSGDGSLVHPCPAHPESVELAGVAANLTFINGRPAMCGCQVEYSSGGGEYSDVIYVTLCAKHSGSAILDLVATNRIALTPEYEGKWHADLYLDREIPLAKAEGATPAEAVLALMSAERIDPEQESVEQAGGDERDFQAKGAQEVPSPVSKEYDRHLISLLRKGEALPGHQEEAADEIERLRDWNDHLNNTVLPNILNPNFLMLMKGGERLLDLCTKDGKFIGVSLNDMKDVFDWMVTHARIAPDHAALAQPSPMYDPKRCLACGGDHGNSGLPCPNMRVTAQAQPSPKCVKCGGTGEADSGGVHPWGEPVLISCDCETEQAEAERPEVVAWAVVAKYPHKDARRAVFFDEAQADTQGAEWCCDDGVVTITPLIDRAFAKQHDRIVGALRAKIAQLRQHKNDYMGAGQETYRALQNEIREREAEIARLDGLVSGRTAERDAALVRVAGLELGIARIAGDFLPDNSGQAELALDEMRQALHELLAAIPTQAQHSVPEEFIGRLSEFLAQRGATGKALLRELRAMLAAAPGKEVPQAWLDVQAERRRQITAEGWTPEHDDLYCAAELPRAAAAYILNGANDEAPAIWPFVAKWWKPRDARSNYVRAGALILAEIERLDRAAPGKEGV